MSKLPQGSSIFHILNTKFDNYACSSILFKLAGLYTVFNTVFSFISNIYIFIVMMMKRTQVISETQSKSIYELTQWTIFQKIPWLNFNAYDLHLVVKYCEILQLYWIFKDLMQDNFASIASQGDSFIFVQYPIRFLFTILRWLFSENYYIDPSWVVQEMSSILVKFIDWSMLRCYAFNATK